MASEAFWANVRKTRGCWLWQGPFVHFGYGQPRIAGKRVLAHRYSFAQANGPIPKGKFVLHRCDTPACVRPSHLFLGTPAENMADMVEKGRSGAGEKNGRAVLRLEQVKAIRASVASQRELAAQYGVSQTLVGKIKRGELWA